MSKEQTTQYPMPGQQCLESCSKIAIAEDKPIMLDYWTPSQDGTVVIGMRENGEKLLVKSPEEYTSVISKIYRIGKEYIILTENSIYLTADSIIIRKIG